MASNTSKLEKILQKRRLHYPQWVNRDGRQSYFQGEWATIDEALGDWSSSSLSQASFSFDAVATWLASLGITKLLKGDSTGWNDIHRGAVYHNVGMRLAVRIGMRSVGARAGSVELAGCDYFLSLLALRTFGAVGPGMLPESVWEQFCIRSKSPVEEPVASFIPFASALVSDGELKARCIEPIENAWRSLSGSPEQFHAAVVALADFHCEQIADDSCQVRAIYRNPPYDIWPVEIICLIKSRQRLDLPIPEVSHPLLDSRFMNVPERPQPISDALLLKADEVLAQMK